MGKYEELALKEKLNKDYYDSLDKGDISTLTDLELLQRIAIDAQLTRRYTASIQNIMQFFLVVTIISLLILLAVAFMS